MVCLSVITFIAAFLLFQIELIIAKLFLPIYGGSFLVWGACIVFFQAALLGGYLFAHTVIKSLNIKKYLKLHLLLLCLPLLFFFPRVPIHLETTSNNLPLVLDIFLRLLLSIGPVFLTLSTISLVTQSWLAASSLKGAAHPYRLYAISNIGSFAALWSYPFWVEPSLPTSVQLKIWGAGYVVLVVLNVLCFFLVKPKASIEKAETVLPVKPGEALKWLILSAAPVMLFLSVTNIITYEVAPLPLLWIVPLSLYLLSFVIAFKRKPWGMPWLNPALIVAVVFAIVLYWEIKTTFLPATWIIILLNVVLFILCLWSARELIRLRPAGGQLTFFYVMISLGGFVGGFLTSWIIPLFTHTLLEFLLGLLLLALMFKAGVTRSIIVIIVCSAIVIDHGMQIHSLVYRRPPSIEIKRNYYGIYDVYDTRGGVRTLAHGTTLHGIQWGLPERRFIPLGYYSPNSPLGEMFIKDIFHLRRVGAIGLGAGTMAMYTKPDLSMDFYELDPDIVAIAKKHFWYLKLAPGLVNVHLGDARLSLQADPAAVYDLLVVDAFGGDAIPVHLINKDVVKIYREHLNPGGGVMFHIPNRYFNLEAVLAYIARDLGAYVAVKEAQQDGITLRTYWALLTWDQDRFIQLIAQPGWRPLNVVDYKPMRTWDDDFSTVLPIIKFDEIFQGLKHFKLY